MPKKREKIAHSTSQSSNSSLKRESLEKGLQESTNLLEFLSIDLRALVQNTFPMVVLPDFPLKAGVTEKMRFIASAFYRQCGFSIFETLKESPSDTIRGIGCYLLALHEISFEKKLQLALADDPHFGVREWAWLALRPFVVKEPLEALRLLRPFVKHPSENMRRFASEITRPRGVWCAHIPLLKKEPWQALFLLEELCSDPAKYVQLSIANWLNDAGKDQPDWVRDLCARWKIASPTLQTQKICQRALRNL